MYTYKIYEWLLFFFFYCFFGWVFESTVVSVSKRRFVKRGFLRGPFIPIYGEGAIMILFVTLPVRENIALIFLMGMIGATVLELAIGALMESIFKVKYWDYSSHKIQYKGYICMSSSLCWGALSVLLIKVIHKPIESLILMLPELAAIILAIGISGYFIYDTVVSIIDAWGMKKILEMITSAKEEMADLLMQLEIKKEITREQWIVRKQELKMRLEDLQLGPDREPLRVRLREAIAEHEVLEQKLNAGKNRILKRNPSASSKKFADALASLKEYMEENRKNGKNISK